MLVTTAVLGAAWLLLGLRDLGSLVVLLSAMLALAVFAVLAAGPAPPRLGSDRAWRILRSETPTPAVGAAHTVRASLMLRRSPAIAIAARWHTPEGLEETALTPGSNAGGRGDRARSYSTSLTVTHPARGQATLRLDSAEVEDPLGLVRRRIAVAAEVTVLVVPRLLPHADGPSGYSVGDGGRDEPTAVRTGTFGAPGSDIREYRTGDSVRHIHWKQSARQRDLVVRTPEHDATRFADVYLATDGRAYPSAESFEHAVSVAATAGVLHLRAGNPVRVRAGSAEPELFMTAADLMRALARVRLDEEPVGAHE